MMGFRFSSIACYRLVLTKVKPTGQATQTEVTLSDIERVRSGMIGFSKYYEREFYQRKWDR